MLSFKTMEVVSAVAPSYGTSVPDEFTKTHTLLQGAANFLTNENSVQTKVWLGGITAIAVGIMGLFYFAEKSIAKITASKPAWLIAPPDLMMKFHRLADSLESKAVSLTGILPELKSCREDLEGTISSFLYRS